MEIDDFVRRFLAEGSDSVLARMQYCDTEDLFVVVSAAHGIRRLVKYLLLLEAIDCECLERYLLLKITDVRLRARKPSGLDIYNYSNYPFSFLSRFISPLLTFYVFFMENFDYGIDYAQLLLELFPYQKSNPARISSYIEKAMSNKDWEKPIGLHL